MTKFIGWVVCLECGHKWFLEQYGSKTRCCCPICSSKEYEVDNNYDDDGYR